MKSYTKRALKDIKENVFLNAIAVLTIALAVLMISGLTLIWFNLNDWVSLSKNNVRIMAYLKTGVTEVQRNEVTATIQGLEGVQNTKFISRGQAMNTLKSQLSHQASLLDGLKENPLPDTLEIELTEGLEKLGQIETIAGKIRKIPAVEDVEYGQQWMDRFKSILGLFQLAGMIMGGIFLIAAGLIVGNTIRLTLFSRQEEIEIMRLVGANDMYIKAPFYIEGAIQGCMGSILGLGGIYAAHTYVSWNINSSITTGFLQIRFLSTESLVVIICGSMGVGLIGCVLSLKQYFRK